MRAEEIASKYAREDGSRVTVLKIPPGMPRRCHICNGKAVKEDEARDIFGGRVAIRYCEKPRCQYLAASYMRFFLSNRAGAYHYR